MVDSLGPTSLRSLQNISREAIQDKEDTMNEEGIPITTAVVINIGYFGIPGRDDGKTHVTRDKKPICRTRIDKRAEFKWATTHSSLRELGPYLNDIECLRCKRKIITKIL